MFFAGAKSIARICNPLTPRLYLACGGGLNLTARNGTQLGKIRRVFASDSLRLWKCGGCLTDDTTGRDRLRLAVAFATSGRRDVLSEVVAALENQTRAPDAVLIAPAGSGDVDEPRISALRLKCAVLESPAGLTRQRNALLRACADYDVVVYFDDDFLAAPDYLEACEAAFLNRRDMVVMTGDVLLDGAHSAGLSIEEARAVIAQSPVRAPIPPAPTYNAYGCNMAIRLDVARGQQITFDESLPLYGWFEDVDFSRRMSAYGTILKISTCRGVHLATKRGKGSGVRLGYSQVINPCYLVQKGSLTGARACAQIIRNVSANLSHCLAPEPWIDRRGRVRGNFLALADLIRGEADPQRVLTL